MVCFCKDYGRLGIYSGLLYQPVFYVFVLVSIYFNPWFSIRTSALSDLGATFARYPWIFDVGLGVASFLGILFSMDFLRKNSGIYGYFSYGILLSSLFFLIITFFPDNLPVFLFDHITVHKFFTLFGFATLVISMFLYSFYWIRYRQFIFGVSLILYGIIVVLIAYFLGGPGWASLEIAVSSVTLIWSYMAIYIQCSGGLNGSATD